MLGSGIHFARAAFDFLGCPSQIAVIAGFILAVVQERRRIVTVRHNALVASLAVIAGMAIGSANAQEKYKTTFNMSWLPQGSVAGFLVAIDKGYYAAEGLDVNAVRGFGGLRTINEIDQGLFEFGYGNPDGVILNRTKGGKTKLVGSVNATNPGGICFVEGRINPKNVADLKGLTLGAAAGTPVTATFPALLKLNKLPADHIKMVQLQGSVIYSALVDGSINFYECWLGSGKPILEHQARKQNLKIGFLSYEDMDLKTMGSGLATTEALIEKRPDIVQKFVKASYRGYADLLKNPEEGADIVKKMFAESDRAVVLDQIHDINKLVKGPGTDKNGLGWIDPGRADETIKFMGLAYQDVAGKITADDIYTNKFIQAK
jgi:NitT/TauT family transport system substrate-binding protein